MIIYKQMDATAINEGVIAHGVNCQRKMRSGIAKTIREKWPRVYEAFMAQPDLRGDMLGIAHAVCVSPDSRLWVVNCYTQEYYGYDSRRYADPDAIETAVRSAAQLAHLYDNLPLFMPRIGCGLGGLTWDEVEPRIHRVAEEVPSIDIVVCDLPTEEETNDTEFYAY